MRPSNEVLIAIDDAFLPRKVCRVENLDLVRST